MFMRKADNDLMNSAKSSDVSFESSDENPLCMDEGQDELLIN